MYSLETGKFHVFFNDDNGAGCAALMILKVRARNDETFTRVGRRRKK